MNVKFKNKGNTLVVSICGELDHHSAEHVRQKLDNEMLKSTTKNMVLDFSHITFMDSSGIGVIMGRYKNLQKLNGVLAVAHVNEQIGRIFELSGLKKIIPVYNDVESAINKM